MTVPVEQVSRNSKFDLGAATGVDVHIFLETGGGRHQYRLMVDFRNQTAVVGKTDTDDSPVGAVGMVDKYLMAAMWLGVYVRNRGSQVVGSIQVMRFDHVRSSHSRDALEDYCHQPRIDRF